MIEHAPTQTQEVFASIFILANRMQNGWKSLARRSDDETIHAHHPITGK
jgi:hypothetical protein